MKKLYAALIALSLLTAPAAAQWQTPNHSVPIGRGAGNTGFGTAAPSISGQALIDNGASADPAFGKVGNAGVAAGAADTYKGSLNGTTTADIAAPPCTAVNQAWRYTAGVGPVCATVSVQTGYDMPVNLGLSTTVGGGALTINVTQSSGIAPTASAPVQVPFRSTTLATGTVTWSSITSALSLIIPSGATLGTTNNIPYRVWIFLEANAGTPAIGVATCSNATTIFGCTAWESTLKTSISIGAGSGTGGVLYATTGVALDAVRIVGYCDFATGQATAGVWTNNCSTLQLLGPGVKRPGEVVQTQYATHAATTTTTSATFVTTGLTASFTPTSAVNLLRVEANGVFTDATNAVAVQLGAGAGPTMFGNMSVHQNSTTADMAAVLLGLVGAGSTSTQTIAAYMKTNSGSTGTWLPSSTYQATATMTIDEIQG